MKVIIDGGGIGGLTLALSLHDAGITNLDVYESPRIGRRGPWAWGRHQPPPACGPWAERTRPARRAVCHRHPHCRISLFTKRGQRIWHEPRGLAAGYRWPQFSIHRGQLLLILYQAVKARLGAERVHTGHHLTRFDEEPDGTVTATFIDRRTDTPLTRQRADLLVGAEGIHSVMRQALYPDEGEPKWNGITMWRGVTDTEPFLAGRTMILAGYFRRRVVVYPISKRHEDQGRALVNWVAEYQTAEDQPMGRQDWDHRGRLEDVLEPFGGYVFDWLDLPNLFSRAEAIYEYPMVDRDPLPRWGFGPVTLLGDAAHPMYPVGSNGASQAILDARVLARALALSDSISAALAVYEDERRHATARVVLLNRQVGPEQCMEIVEQRAPDGFDRIEDVISHEELEEIALRYKQAAGFSVDALNNRPSLSVMRPIPTEMPSS